VRKLFVELLFLLYCSAATLFIITLQICYVWIFEYLGGPTFKWVGLLSNEVGLFSGESVLKSTPPALSSHLSSSPMAIFSKAYGTDIFDIYLIAD